MRRWEREFDQSFDVPQEIEQLVERGILFDSSWHNDLYPSFGFAKDSDADELRLWVDHPDASKREMPECARFTLAHNVNDFVNTDEVSVIIDHILAIQFSKVLRRWLSSVQMKVVTETNKARNDNTCATHDYCDSNMAMDEAWNTLFPREMFADGDENPDQHAADCEQVNRSWDIAKSDEFNTFE